MPSEQFDLLELTHFLIKTDFIKNPPLSLSIFNPLEYLPDIPGIIWPKMDSAELVPVPSALKAQDACLLWQEEQLELVHQEILEMQNAMNLDARHNQLN